MFSLHFQSLSECSDRTLDSLPARMNLTRPNVDSSPFSLDYLKTVYTQFYHLSAHFHVINRDWTEGRVCSAATTEDVKVQTAR